MANTMTQIDVIKTKLLAMNEGMCGVKFGVLVWRRSWNMWSVGSQISIGKNANMQSAELTARMIADQQ